MQPFTPDAGWHSSGGMWLKGRNWVGFQLARSCQTFSHCKQIFKTFFVSELDYKVDDHHFFFSVEMEVKNFM